MRKSLFGVIAVALLMCLGAGNANAQGKIGLFAGYAYGTANYGCAFTCFDPGLHGYALAGTYSFTNHIALEANFSGHNGSPNIYYRPVSASNYGETDTGTADIYTYTFGPKISLPLGNFTLFTHFLVGGQHVHLGYSDACVPYTNEEGCGFTSNGGSAKGNGMAFKTGGGLDWNHGMWGIRILEVDYSHSEPYMTGSCSDCNSEPTSENVNGNNFELSTGVTFNFGKQ